MSYLVLARKYRPQTFEDVVGQSPVSQTLLNALEAGKVAHAYVFSGPRGVGKTTTARILAKCLNCEKGPTKTPCNKCEACRAISLSSSTDDVLEIDGASNRGIEQIRELRESAKYAPSRSRYRIFIIDEAHQITKDAFGALLKTLEEPPEHVVFMLATTEVQKIPAPILSRCQRFALKPISAPLVLEHLKKICRQESVKVEDQALAIIVRFVEGSLRDALSIMDQAIAFSPSGITVQTVRDLLGLLPEELVRTFAAKVVEGAPAALLQQINQAVQSGVDLTQLGKDLQHFYHQLLLLKAGVDDPLQPASADKKKETEHYDFATLERNIRLLQRALDDMRTSEAPRAIFEIAVLKLAQKTLDPRVLIERLEKLESSLAENPARAIPAEQTETRAFSPSSSYGTRPSLKPQPGKAAESPAPRTEDHTPKEAITSKKQPDGNFNAANEPNQDNAPSPAPMDSSNKEAVISKWPEFLGDVSKIKFALASSLEQATVDVDGQRIILTFYASFHRDLVVRSLSLLQTPMAKRFGAGFSIDTKLEKPPEKPQTTQNQAPNNSLSPQAQTPVSGPEDNFEDVPAASAGTDVQKVMKHFPGHLKRERKPE